MGSRALWYLTFDSFDKNNQGRGGSEKEKTKASSPTINDNEVILIKNTRIRLIALFCWWWGAVWVFTRPAFTLGVILRGSCSAELYGRPVDGRFLSVLIRSQDVKFKWPTIYAKHQSQATPTQLNEPNWRWWRQERCWCLASLRFKHYKIFNPK